MNEIKNNNSLTNNSSIYKEEINNETNNFGKAIQKLFNQQREETKKTYENEMKRLNKENQTLKQEMEAKESEAKLLENKITEFILNFQEKELESEEFFQILEAILSKDKKKYEFHFVNLSEQTQMRLEELKKRYKYKLK